MELAFIKEAADEPRRFPETRSREQLTSKSKKSS